MKTDLRYIVERSAEGRWHEVDVLLSLAEARRVLRYCQEKTRTRCRIIQKFLERRVVFQAEPPKPRGPQANRRHYHR